MELRFLSPELKSISDPVEQDIENALMKLALLKGKEKTGVVLLHSNGKDFLQCYVMDDEECRAVKFLGVVFFCFSILCWAGRYKPIRPWGAGGGASTGEP